MTRTELADVVWRRHGGISRREARELVDLILRLIKTRLARGERVVLAGFGTFTVVRGPDRLRRHPVTGRRLRVPGRRRLVFRPSRRLDRAFASDDSLQELA